MRVVSLFSIEVPRSTCFGDGRQTLGNGKEEHSMSSNSNNSAEGMLSDLKNNIAETERAVASLVEQGCGEPHFIPVGRFILVQPRDLRNAIKDAKKKGYNQHLRGDLLEEVLSQLSRTDNALLYVWGAHAQFDYPNQTDALFTTQPYRSINLRAALLCEGGLLQVGDLDFTKLGNLNTALQVARSYVAKDRELTH